MSRQKHTTVVHVEAECQVCDWRSEAANALANAARHHDATDHYVSTSQTIRVDYGRGPAPEELGQMTIGDQ